MTSETRPTRGTVRKRTVLAWLAVLSAGILLSIWLPGILGDESPENDGDEMNGGGGDGIGASKLSFTITGKLPGRLVPGQQQALNLELHNRTPGRLSVTSLTVTVVAVAAPSADARHPCAVTDFAASQLEAPYPLSIDSRATTDLARLGLPSDLWPRIEMLNTARNQDGCIGARLRLGFSGTSRASAS